MSGSNIIFYTTGRLTSEIIMKSKHMGIPIIISRSGVTNMGIELAKDLNITMIARSKQRSFLIYNNKKILYLMSNNEKTKKKKIR